VGDARALCDRDVRTLTSLRDQIGPVDAIFHLAAIVSDWGATQEHVDITVHGTEQAIDLAIGWVRILSSPPASAPFASALAKVGWMRDSPVGVPSSPMSSSSRSRNA